MNDNKPSDELDELFDIALNAKQAAIDFASEAELFGDNAEVLRTSNFMLEDIKKKWQASLRAYIAQETPVLNISQFKAYFEANLLDGNDIHTDSKGTMLSAQEVYKVIVEYLTTTQRKAIADRWGE